MRIHLPFLITILSIHAFVTYALADEDVISDTYLPQTVITLEGEEFERLSFYFCPCMRTMLFSNFDQTRCDA